MKQADLIDAVLNADPERHAAILAAVRGSGRARPVNTRAAAELLGVHPKTLLRYVREGLLHPTRLSKRMLRFDLNQVEALLAGKGAA